MFPCQILLLESKQNYLELKRALGDKKPYGFYSPVKTLHQQLQEAKGEITPVNTGFSNDTDQNVTLHGSVTVHQDPSQHSGSVAQSTEHQSIANHLPSQRFDFGALTHQRLQQLDGSFINMGTSIYLAFHDAPLGIE